MTASLSILLSPRLQGTEGTSPGAGSRPIMVTAVPCQKILRWQPEEHLADSRYQPLAPPHSRPTPFHPFIHPRSSPSPVSSTSSSDYFEANQKHHIFFNCKYVNIKLQRKITLLKNITTILCPTSFTWTSLVAQW